MPTSAIGISTDEETGSTAVAVRRITTRADGFTLLELLVVVTIIGILAGALALSTGLVRDERDIEREVMRLQTLIELAREEAIMQSREYAILFGETGYRFYVYDYQTERWSDPPGDALLAPRELDAPMEVELRVEDRDVVLDPAALKPADAGDEDDDDDDAPQPQVMILSSGEMTAFEADFYRDPVGGRIKLTAELDGTLTTSKEGFDGR